MKVGIVATGVANLASVEASFERLGAVTTALTDPDGFASCTHVVLPGVGAFAAGMASLKQSGLDEALRDWVSGGRALLAICLGMQLLFETSEESPGVPGLGIMPGTVRAFPPGVRSPHFGWNQVGEGAGWIAPGHYYFAHSYRAENAPPGWETAWSSHASHFVAAVHRGAVVACQFHPELSGEAGSRLIRSWLEEVGPC